MTHPIGLPQKMAMHNNQFLGLERYFEDFLALAGILAEHNWLGAGKISPPPPSILSQKLRFLARRARRCWKALVGTYLIYGGHFNIKEMYQVKAMSDVIIQLSHFGLWYGLNGPRRAITHLQKTGISEKTSHL